MYSQATNRTDEKKTIISGAWIASAIYGAILIVLNFIRIFDNCFWGDEAYSILLAKQSIPDMVTSTSLDVHPPLYYLFLIFANRLAGDHGWVYHFVSVIPFVVLVVFALTVIWRRFGGTASVIFLTFMGISDLAVTYNVEARMYSLASMFVLFSFYGLYKLLNEEKGGELFFVLASLGAAYTHYFAMMSVAVFYLALLIWTIIGRFEKKKLLICYVCTFLGYAPWLVQMVKTFKRTSEDFWIAGIPGIKDCVEYYFYSDKEWYSLGMFAIVTFLVIYRLICDKTDITAIWLLFGFAAAIGTSFIGEFISLAIRPAFITRYLYPVTSVMWLVLGVEIAQLGKRKTVLAVAVVAVSLALFIPNYLAVYEGDKSDDQKCSETQKAIQMLVDENDIILTNGAHLDWTILDYYLPGVQNQLITNEFGDFEENRTYWLAWKNELSEEDNMWLEGHGYLVKEELSDAMLGLNSFHFYRLQSTAE